MEQNDSMQTNSTTRPLDNSVQSTTISQSTNYKDLMIEAGKQLGLRKKDIFKRVILATWPMMIFGLSFVLAILYFQSNQEAWADHGTVVSVSIFCWAVFAILYGTLIRTIFSIEKRIWIDSCFDGKNLSTSQSWHVAKRLFFSLISFRIKLFFRYYAIIWIIYFALIAACFLLHDPYAGIAFAAVLLGFPIIMWLYSHYYLQTYLRFAWFLFLDMFGAPAGSFRDIMSEMRKLNNISKSDSFKKALVAEIGSDSVTFIVNTMTGFVLAGFSALNKEAGAIISSVVKVPAEEMASQSADFAKLAAIYLLYRKARELSGENAQFINEKLYSLSN